MQKSPGRQTFKSRGSTISGMTYDIIFVTGEIFFDHPLCGVAILKRLLESEGYSVGVIESPGKEEDIARLGEPRLFFGVTSGSIDSMVRNYTPLKKRRDEDIHAGYVESVPDRAVLVYCNWIKRRFKGSVIVLGGTEASLRRFVHYDYWENRLRRPILVDTRADILAFGQAEKQVLEIARRLAAGESLQGIAGTCVIEKEIPKGFTILPSETEVLALKERFCDLQNLLSNDASLAQKTDARYVLQYKSPEYTSQDLDRYYSQDFSREIPKAYKHLRGFEFSVVTHRGCIGGCHFCSLSLMQGGRIISRSEASILDEIKRIASLPGFRGNIDDLGGPSANMYGMDCTKCTTGGCIDCTKLDRSNGRLIALLSKARAIKGIKHVYIRSGIRYDLSSPTYLKQLFAHHVFDTLRVAPEHVDREVLRLMGKDRGHLNSFLGKLSKKDAGKVSFYFMVGHPGCGLQETKKLQEAIAPLKNAEAVQIFTPTPMTVSTCMYYTGLDPKTRKNVYVPYSYHEKKVQKSMVTTAKKKRDDFD